MNRQPKSAAKVAPIGDTAESGHLHGDQRHSTHNPPLSQDSVIDTPQPDPQAFTDSEGTIDLSPPPKPVNEIPWADTALEMMRSRIN